MAIVIVFTRKEMVDVFCIYVIIAIKVAQMTELEIDKEYIYQYASERHGKAVRHVTVCFRVIGKTDWDYTIRFTGPRPSWMNDTSIMIGSGMHRMSIPLFDSVVQS